MRRVARTPCVALARPVPAGARVRAARASASTKAVNPWLAQYQAMVLDALQSATGGGGGGGGAGDRQASRALTDEQSEKLEEALRVLKQLDMKLASNQRVDELEARLQELVNGISNLPEALVSYLAQKNLSIDEGQTPETPESSYDEFSG